MDQGGMRESVQAELERFDTGYWSKFMPAGNPIPGFFSALPGGDLLPMWLARKTVDFVPQYLLLFALEVEHRRNPIETRDALKEATLRICTDGYDFRAAEALSEDVRVAYTIARERQ